MLLRGWGHGWAAPIFLLLLSGSGSGAEGIAEDDDLSDAQVRRVHRRLQRKIHFHREDVDAVDARGHLPALEVGGMRLREVFLVHERDPWKIRHASVPEGYEPRRLRRRHRRLQELLDAVDTPIVFDTPQDKVRMMAVLNAAAQPLVAYNSTAQFPGSKGVYLKGKMAFAPLPPKNMSGVNTSNGTNSTVNESNFTYSDEEAAAFQAKDWEALKDARLELRQTINKSWSSDNFLGKRSQDCMASLVADPECVGDVGVGLSVYDDGTSQVLVFHSGYLERDYEYLVWLYRIWILEEFEDKVVLSWGLGGQQPLAADYKERRTETREERPVRCALKDAKYVWAPDIPGLAFAVGASASQLAVQGLWLLVKSIVRVILPEDRPKSLVKTTYLTGSGVGGLHAALASMWLKKADAATYKTYVIAGVGWQCTARRLYTADMDPWAAHPQITSYSHVLDMYANALDRMSGTVCLYGLKNVTGTPVEYFCGQIVGHSGPELLYRGPPIKLAVPTKNKLPGVVYLKETPTAGMLAAQLAFDACHYYTHSAWFAAMQFADANILMLDGTTDGGCQSVAEVDQPDVLNHCPLTTKADIECLLLLDTTVPLPYAAMLQVAGTLTAFICTIALFGYTCLSRVRSDKHLFEEKKKSTHRPFPCCCLKRAPTYGVRDRAKEAKERAKKAREKGLMKEAKKQGLVGMLSQTSQTFADAMEQQREKKEKKKKKKKGEEVDPFATAVAEGEGEGEGEVPATTLGAPTSEEDVLQSNAAKAEAGMPTTDNPTVSTPLLNPSDLHAATKVKGVVDAGSAGTTNAIGLAVLTEGPASPGGAPPPAGGEAPSPSNAGSGGGKPKGASVKEATPPKHSPDGEGAVKKAKTHKDPARHKTSSGEKDKDGKVSTAGGAKVAKEKTTKPAKG